MSGLVLQVFKTESFVDFSNERYKGESMLRFSSSASVLGDGLQWRTKQFTKDALDDLKNLEILELFFSDIDPNSIDFTSFKNLRNLKELKISNLETEDGTEYTSLKFHRFDIKLDHLNKLNKLKLCGFEIDMDIVKNLQNLTHLDLRNNKLINLKSENFIHNKDLKCLKLDDCNLKKLKSNLSFDSTSLKKFSLENNNLKSLPLNLFSKLPNLEEVELSNNRLSEIDVKLFEANKKLNKLYICMKIIFSKFYQLKFYV
jgi:Leucine-rich repeat (LRR) protein